MTMNARRGAKGSRNHPTNPSRHTETGAIRRHLWRVIAVQSFNTSKDLILVILLPHDITTTVMENWTMAIMLRNYVIVIAGAAYEDDTGKHSRA